MKNGNGFEQHKISILQSIDGVKKVQEKHSEKLEELKVMVIERFAKMDTAIAVMKTKMVFIMIGVTCVLSVGINLIMRAI